ncbi:hypothetical protein HYH02_001790 [Chlamydomonas schloesseri]|uniref:CRAL-TRIO domain-containing protein n=1 Tax=Chlamydomonas schloesseri TaxID=2026947 RepID=A0A835WVR7_9CHLO|nr:hypothetical protein HYH02_001790 [Chlamydomonas schloesseri]|eukprot:KAG2453571.1 hypothetical protein HYH02_001790 [Chlamydomonas schloesseri]
MLEKHVAWRRGAGRPVEESHHGVQVNLAHKKVFLQGLDKTGRPIVLGVGSRHRKFETKEDALAFCTYALDTACAIGNSHEDWDGKLTGVFDLRNLSLKNMDLTALQVMFELLQNHYPERLGRLFLYEAPVAFYAIWRAVSPFVDPVTKTKINFVYAKNAHDDFEKVFDLHLLPTDLGGEGDYHPIEEAHKRALERVAARAGSASPSPSPSGANGTGSAAAAAPAVAPAGEGAAAAAAAGAAVGAPAPTPTTPTASVSASASDVKAPQAAAAQPVPAA